MITYVSVPQYFENMEEATIGAWLKKEGAPIAKGEALCELITEKTTFELESEADGILRRILAPEKSIVPVGFTLALLGDENEVLPDIEAENTALKQLEQAAAPTKTDSLSVPSLSVPSLSVSLPGASAHPASPAVTSAGSRVRATPAARRAARDKGVAIEDVAAAFPGKVISEEDVANFGG